jgi:cytochrome P450
MQPAFHHQRIASYGRTMIRYAQRHGARWHNGQEVDMHEEMMRLTLAVVAKTLFDADVEEEAEEIGEALTKVLELFALMPLPFANLLDRLPLPRNKRFQRAKDRLDATIYRMIETRRRSGEDKGDLLSMLLMAQDTDDHTGMTDQQVRDEAITLFLAGHETTANALSWTWYLLSQHPEVEAKLQAELHEVLGENPPTVEGLNDLRYTRMVLAEAMRLYPPAYVLGRRAQQEHELGGYPIPASSILIMSQFVMHRDPRYHAEPEIFNPERWHPERQEAQPKFSYFPFGGGPRVCIGEPFAWMEGVLILATLAQSWRMRLVPGHPVGLQPLITLRPKGGMKMTVNHRQV